MREGSEVWAVASANLRRHAHLILRDQLVTTQAAKCGYEPRHYWLMVDDPTPAVRTYNRRMRRCRRCRKAATR